MCDEYYFLRKKASDTATRSKEQVQKWMEEVTAAATMYKQAAVPAPAVKSPEPEKETA